MEEEPPDSSAEILRRFELGSRRVSKEATLRQAMRVEALATF